VEKEIRKKQTQWIEFLGVQKHSWVFLFFFFGLPLFYLFFVFLPYLMKNSATWKAELICFQ